MSEENWIKAAQVEDLGPGEGFETDVEINGETIGIFYIDDKYYALGECSHEQGPLSQGLIDGNRVTCPWHSAKFDITTGENIDFSAACRLSGSVSVGTNDEDESLPGCNSYKVKVDGNDIYVLSPQDKDQATED
jgi:nitrite reductase/ring-hydroxylating ferredoxin subunit